MAIDRIARLRHPGVLRDFTWSGELPNFGRYNLIYGWNGTGKTTISRLFRALELKTAPLSGEGTLTINGADVKSSVFTNATLPVRVFNRDFITESVFPVGGREVAPILVIGKESVEKQREIEQLRKSLEVKQQALESGRARQQEAEKALDKYCIDRAAVIKDTLRSSGSNPYNNYDKSRFRHRAIELLTTGAGKSHCLTDSERATLLTQHHASPKPALHPLTHQLPELAPCAEAMSELCSTMVVSAAIQSLKDDPSLSAWVRQGIGLHRDKQADQCLFCEQFLPSTRLVTLEAHFNAEFERFMSRLDAEISKLSATAKEVEGLALPNRAEFYDDLAAEFKDAEAGLRNASSSAKNFLDSLVQALRNKKTRPFEKLDREVIVPDADAAAVDRINEVIEKHNQATKDFEARVTTARQRLEADAVAGVLAEFQRLRDDARLSANAITNVAAERKHLLEAIEELERDMVDHLKPAEELNEDLRRYLGHSELRLEIKDTGYAITRNGVAAMSLSEGEETALALLYFLKALKDRRFDLAKGVVVLDDPISSLDTNSLYLAFGFIRERTKDAAQLFILTHNFTFFRQVRNWFHHLKGQNKKDVSQRPARFYMLDCLSDRDPRCSTIRPLDRLLEQFESEYHYLFYRIYSSATAPARAGLEDNYALPNIARRLLEAFLAFRQPAKSGELWQKMQDAEFDESKKVRILRLLHTHSHSGAIGEPEHDPSLLGETASVLKDLLEFLKAQDPGHFAAMVELVTPPSEQGGDA
jgi:wobble nucleotide-excising tRNase